MLKLLNIGNKGCVAKYVIFKKLFERRNFLHIVFVNFIVLLFVN